jgi:hypothetical protein
LIAGFARAGRIAAAEWAVRPLTEGEEAKLLLRLQVRAPTDWRILGVDWEGMDASAPGEGRLRVLWDPMPADEAALMDAASRALAA